MNCSPIILGHSSKNSGHASAFRHRPCAASNFATAPISATPTMSASRVKWDEYHTLPKHISFVTATSFRLSPTTPLICAPRNRPLRRLRPPPSRAKLSATDKNLGNRPDGFSKASDRHKARALVARFKVQRRIAVGVIMGAVVIAFVFSGRWVFALGMLAISLTGLYEYYRMVAAKGHLPAYKMGLCVTAATLLSSAFSPTLADVVFPVGGTMICIYLLFRRRKIATIADISTTFMGLFYAGYLPSYWIRLHEYNGVLTQNVVAGVISFVWPHASGFQPTITVGSLIVFWTWLAGACADIGAFFVGRTYGRTRFSNISPKKTVEGAVAGFLCSASVSVLGAYLLQWPVWWATGAVYGVTVGILGLCGDLFESCFKRDVGWKDSGSLFPGHGGMLDRADSYVLVAPLVYFFATLVLPFITRIVR